MRIIVLAIVFALFGCGEPHSPAKEPLRKSVEEVAVADQVVEKPVAVPKKVLITIDDVPVAMRGTYNAKERLAVADGLCKVLEQHGVPAVAFANMVHAKADRAALEFWKACENVILANHTWSHPHLNKVGIDRYLEDVQKGHDAVRKVVPAEQPIYFRYPYLMEGDLRAERDAIRELLDKLDSTHIPVTVETMDWYYAKKFHSARRSGDLERAEVHRQSWRRDLEEATLEAEWYSDLLFDQQVPQVVLLHANLLNAESLGDYLGWLKERGYVFVTAAEVVAHPAYKDVVTITSSKGETRWKSLYRNGKLESRASQ